MCSRSRAGSTVTRPVKVSIFCRQRNGYALHVYADGTLTMSHWFGGAAAAVSTVPVPSSGWHHCVGTKNGTDIHLYIDGVDVTGATNAVVYGDSPWDAAIGADDWYYDHYAGSLDEVAVYPTALSPARVLAHYQAAAVADISETGRATDVATVQQPGIPIAGAETGVGTDTAQVPGVSHQTADTGTGADASGSLSAAPGATGEAGVGTSAAALAAAFSGAPEAGGATDASSLAAAYQSSDSGTATETSSLAVTNGVNVTDAAVGADASAGLAVVLPTRTDAGTGADVAMVSSGNAISTSDSAVGVDSATTAIGASGTDAGAGVDTAQAPTVQIFASDGGTGADLAALSAAYALVDAGVAVDLASAAAALVRVDSGGGIDLAVLTLGVTATDSAIGSDTRTGLAADIARSDTGTGAETTTGRGLGATETAVAVEVAQMAALLPLFDSGASLRARR